MFSVIAAAIAAGKQLYEAFKGKPVPPRVQSAIEASTNLMESIKTGFTKVTDDDGTEMTPAEFQAKFEAWEAAQAAARAGASSRIDQRHSGPDGHSDED
jgi:hypothetical protein